MISRYALDKSRATAPQDGRSLPWRAPPGFRGTEAACQRGVACRQDAGGTPVRTSTTTDAGHGWPVARAGATVPGTMSDTLKLTIVYEDAGDGDGDGWIMARIPEVPGALSQGRTRAEARENVIDALHGILELRFGEHALTEPASDSEPLELTIAA